MIEMPNVTVKENLINIDLGPQIKEILDSIRDDCAKEISNRSPKGYTGDYAVGWTSDLTQNSKGEYTATVYNSQEHPILSHLLELGHRSRSGKTVPPQEHIRPVYNKYQNVYLNGMKRIKIEPK
jgi:hypothetical protein